MGAWWAREDSNLRVGYLVYSQAQSPLCHTPVGLVTRIELVYLEPQSSALPLSYTDRRSSRTRTGATRRVEAVL